MKKIVISGILLIALSFLSAQHAVYVEVLNSGAANPTGGELTYEAWILGRPGEVLTETSTGCDYNASFAGHIAVQAQTFPTQWAPDDVIHIEATETSNSETGVKEGSLTSGGYDFLTPAMQLSGAAPIDWGTGMTGSIDVGTPSLPGSGYGTGLPNEDLLANPANVGLFFTLTIDDGAPVVVTICLDLTTLVYIPYNLAYWVNGAWVYVPPSGPVTWTADCVTFTLDPTSAVRSDVDIPIVFSNGDGPLPVILSNFTTAIFANEFVEISWATQTESNMSLWNLHREYQGSNIIIHTEAATNTTVTHNYMFQDAEVINGETYTYYLEAISYDGTSQLWGPVNATMEGNGTDVPPPGLTELIGNHPNPFNPDTFIVFNVKENETAKLSIYNTKGQVVMNRTFEPGYHNYNWQADTNSSGVYFYKLQSESHTSVKKMLLLK